MPVPMPVTCWEPLPEEERKGIAAFRGGGDVHDGPVQLIGDIGERAGSALRRRPGLIDRVRWPDACRTPGRTAGPADDAARRARSATGHRRPPTSPKTVASTMTTPTEGDLRTGGAGGAGCAGGTSHPSYISISPVTPLAASSDSPSQSRRRPHPSLCCRSSCLPVRPPASMESVVRTPKMHGTPVLQPHVWPRLSTLRPPRNRMRVAPRITAPRQITAFVSLPEPPSPARPPALRRCRGTKATSTCVSTWHP